MSSLKKKNTKTLQCVWKMASILNLRWNMCLYLSVEDKFVSGSIHHSGQWEGAMVAKMIATMRNHTKSMLLDIGGNIGYYALAAGAANFDVHVFEPVPSNAAMIQQSISMNDFKTIQLHTVALGANVGEFGMGTSHSNQGGVRHGADVISLTSLPTFELDRILTPVERPIYIKIDIEGGECDALRGMKTYLAQAKEIIGVNMEFGQSRKKCCNEWVQPNGFFDLLHRRHRLCPSGVSYDSVCVSQQWDLVWSAC